MEEKSPCISDGAPTSQRLPNGHYLCLGCTELWQRFGWLDSRLDLTDRFFEQNPGLKRVIGRDGKARAYNPSLPPDDNL